MVADDVLGSDNESRTPLLFSSDTQQVPHVDYSSTHRDDIHASPFLPATMVLLPIYYQVLHHISLQHFFFYHSIPQYREALLSVLPPVAHPAGYSFQPQDGDTVQFGHNYAIPLLFLPVHHHL